MRAISTPGGGVMFIEDDLERKSTISANILEDEKPAPARKRISLFGRRLKEKAPEEIKQVKAA